MSISQPAMQNKTAQRGVCTPVTRKKSARTAAKENMVELPKDYYFLVYFERDDKFDLVKHDHSGWPSFLTNNIKLSLRYEDVAFKDDKKPKCFHNGLVVTHGPEAILKHLGDYMNLKLSEGVEIRDMNLTQNFERARLAAEKEKNASFLKEQSVNRLVETPGRGNKSVEIDRESWVDESDEEADVPGPEVLNKRVVPNKEVAVNINNDQVVN